MVLSSNAQQKQLRFNRISVENGLLGLNISQIIQDKLGYIWIGTEAGLVRYDGYHVKSYKLEISKSVSINKIYEDHSGILWIQGNDKLYQYNYSADSFTSRKTGSNILSIQDDNRGNLWLGSSQDIYCLNSNKGIDNILHFSTETKGKNKIDASSLTSVFADPKGRIWIGTDSGLHYYDTLSRSIKKYNFSSHDIDSKYVAAIWATVSQPDILWIKVGIWKDSLAVNLNVSFASFVSKGIISVNLKNHTANTYQTGVNESFTIGDNTINTVYEDTKKRIWMGTSSGLSLFDNMTERFINYSDKKIATPVYEIKEDPGGNFWCYTKNGLLYFNIQTKIFTKYNNDEKEANTLQGNVRNIFIDKQGTLWIGTRDQGLYLANWKRSGFTLYKNTPDNNYTGGATFDFTESKDGTIWLASANGLYHWIPGTDEFKKINLLKRKGDPLYVRDVIVDKEGVVWCSSLQEGLFSYNPVTDVIKNYRYSQKDTTSLTRDGVFSILEDRSGTIWVACGGLCSYNRKLDNFTRYHESERIWRIYEDREGEIVVSGFDDGEIKKVDKINKTLLSFEKDSTISGIITLYYEDKQNNLWQGSSDGLFLSNPQNKKAQKFSDKDGLFYDQINGISEDAKGNIWVNGLRGLFVYEPVTKLFRNISTANGLPENQLDGKSFISKAGKIFIGSHDGFIVFNPNDFSADENTPVIHIESLNYKTKSGGNSEKDTSLHTYGLKAIHLRYYENRIIFTYVGLYYQNSSLIQYAYKLDGYDKDWIQNGSQRTVTYTNLSPGTYTFHVKAANSDGIWSTLDDSITIIISPPWWRTWWAYVLYMLLFTLCVWGFIAYRSRAIKQKNKQLEETVERRTSELKNSLDELKSTQKQLIKQEKMASLGELTAGIAHEIQNPLNFVNNFSDVSTELVDEMNIEIDKGNTEDAKQIAQDLKQNLEKINHHGKRAGDIVKSMLQHSRSSSGVKEPTDINALAEEYLRLAYHGLRAKDKTFNATMKTDFDQSIGNINIIPQDIGRVILNLITNAFYVVNEKNASTSSAGQSYEPTVSVSTKKNGNNVLISVKDNGNGIPQKVLDKIFQPFFTTKPTGQGTGLGLSLSYDIVIAHGGELKVETKEGEGSEFVIQLPFKSFV